MTLIQGWGVIWMLGSCSSCRSKGSIFGTISFPWVGFIYGNFATLFLFFLLPFMDLLVIRESYGKVPIFMTYLAFEGKLLVIQILNVYIHSSSMSLIASSNPFSRSTSTQIRAHEYMFGFGSALSTYLPSVSLMLFRTLSPLQWKGRWGRQTQTRDN